MESLEIDSKEVKALVFNLKENKKEKLKDLIFQVYKEIFETLHTENKNLLRIWNFIPDILKKDPIERYRIFNEARWNAWEQFGDWNEDDTPIRPATTAIGGENLQIKVMMTDFPVIHLENPRQKQFIHYSKKWGRRPPISARGTFHDKPNEPEIFISGTASLVGEEVKHKNKVLLQIEETMKNMKVLISSCNLEKHNIKNDFRLEELENIVAYVKNREDFSLVQKEILKITNTKEIKLIHTDVCRPDFLLEIEGSVKAS